MQVDLVVLVRAPEPFDEDVVAPATHAVHADLNVAIAQRLEEVHARELGEGQTTLTPQHAESL